MRQELIMPSLLRRLGDRANLVLLLLVGGLFCLFRISLGTEGVTVAELAIPFVFLFVHLALAPVPWQWTGDGRPMAGVGRGFLQALLFNALWIGLLLSLLHLTGPGPRRHGHHPRPPASPSAEPGTEPLVPPPPGGAEGGFPEPPPPPRPMRPWPAGMGLGLVNLAFAIVFGWVLASKEAMEAREASTANLLRQARSRALQSQLEPHVLYNALNGLSELVHEDPGAAEEMIALLADLYRMLTQHGEAEFVPLLRERQLVEAYLAMERMRLGERLRVQWDWPAWADAVVLPPLLLQPLVENAVKHGISASDAGGELRISVTREEGWTDLEVANTGLPPGAAKKKEGVGLANLAARLELWTEGAGAFNLEREGAWTFARVRFRERRP